MNKLDKDTDYWKDFLEDDTPQLGGQLSAAGENIRVELPITRGITLSHMDTDYWKDPSDGDDDDAFKYYTADFDFDLTSELESDEQEKLGLTDEEYQTKELFNYIERYGDKMDTEEVKKYLKKGASDGRYCATRH